MNFRKELSKKWKTPYFTQKLTQIKFNEVGLRGVKNTTIEFNYQKLQLIFTTHSPFLFDAMPKEGRILLKKAQEGLEVIYRPSSSLAFAELTGEVKKELMVYVEDKVAKTILESLLGSALRKRLTILDVGSKENLVRMIGSHHQNPLFGQSCCYCRW